jgi:hypothetical protein
MSENMTPLAQAGAPRNSHWLGSAIPVTLVNATAFIGQFAWVEQHVPWIWPGQVLFAVALESVAIYLAWHAHMAQLADDSAGRLKLAAVLFALVIGAMNYSHYSVDWRPNALAVGLGLMSALSPWLWGIHSRRASRDRLKAQGLIEGHAVRLGANRVMWHPWRAVSVMSASAWSGENNPQRAIALYELAHPPRRAEVAAPAQVAAAVPVAQEPAVPAIAPAPAPAAQPAPAPAVPAAVQAPAPAVPVRAIAALSCEPKLSASHPIDAQRLADTELHLAGLPADRLPSGREVGRMLCPDHDHRRQAAPLIAARKAAGQAPLPAFARTSRPVNGSNVIATPVSTLPGGASANG